MVVAFLIVAPWVLIVIAVIMIVGNGIILLTVAKNASLRQKDCLYLISGLAVADFITGIGTLPYCTNMILHQYTNCTRGSILGSMVLNIGGVRMNQFITLFIGLDRLYAMLFPIDYRTKNHIKIAQFVTFAGLLMGSIDAAMYLMETTLSDVMPTCNLLIAIGPKSRVYRFVTDLIMNVSTQVIYAYVYYKIYKLKNGQTNDASRIQLRQANHTISLLLLCSLLLLTIPSLVNMCDYLSNLGIFKIYGPTLSIAICINGSCNIFIYPWTHRDFNEAIRALFTIRRTNVVHPKPHLMVHHEAPKIYSL